MTAISSTRWPIPSFEMTPDLEDISRQLQRISGAARGSLSTPGMEYEAQQEFMEKEEEYIRRNMAGQNTRQAQGRLKRLERLLAESQLSRPRKSRSLHFGIQQRRPIRQPGAAYLQLAGRICR